MMYVRFLLSLRNVENLLFERAIDIRHDTVRFWCKRFGVRIENATQRVGRMRGVRHRRWQSETSWGEPEHERLIHHGWRECLAATGCSALR